MTSDKPIEYGPNITRYINEKQAMGILTQGACVGPHNREKPWYFDTHWGVLRDVIAPAIMQIARDLDDLRVRWLVGRVVGTDLHVIPNGDDLNDDSELSVWVVARDTTSLRPRNREDYFDFEISDKTR